MWYAEVPGPDYGVYGIFYCVNFDWLICIKYDLSFRLIAYHHKKILPTKLTL